MHMRRAWVVALLMLLTAGPVFAQMDDREGQGDPNWWRYRNNSELRSAINALDNNAIPLFPIPVLLGVELSDIGRNFGDPRGGGTRLHEGLDMITPRGAPIVSPTDAVVTRVGEWASAGIHIYTANPGGETFAYMHLDSVADGIVAGKTVARGEIIGFVGNTGNASGGAPHLHFETRNGGAQDPYPRLSGSFSLAERVASVNAYLERTTDTSYAQFLVDEYASTFREAIAQGITLTPLLIQALDGIENSSNEQPSSASPYANEESPNAKPGFAFTANSEDLDVGSDGAAVIELQQFLIQNVSGSVGQRLANTGATGYFGPITQGALAEFQEANGIEPAAGYYGPITRAFINGVETEVSTEEESKIYNFGRDLTIGSRGEDVRELQQFLNAQGFTVATSGAGSSGEETTYFGSLTRTALANYQAAHGITPAVGYFGPITRAHLEANQS